MPLIRTEAIWQSLTTVYTSPSGLTDPRTGQAYFAGGLVVGGYADLTEAEAQALSGNVLHEGRYRFVQVDSAATAANIKTGTIGLLSSLLNAASKQPNQVTSFDAGMAADVRPVVFLAPLTTAQVTAGAYVFVQELGTANVLGKSSGCTGSIGDVILAASGDAGAVTDPTQSGNPTWTTLKSAIGVALDQPENSQIFRVLLGVTTPVVQG